MCMNQQCMGAILQHLTRLIRLSDYENIKDVATLVDLSTSVSAQLLAMERPDMTAWANDGTEEY